METSCEPLTAEEERELFKKVKRGDQKARHRIILSQIRMARMLGMRYARRCKHHEDDVVQAAVLGLVQAVDHFDLSTGARFSTLAQFHIRNAMRDYTARSSRAVTIGWLAKHSVMRDIRNGIHDPKELSARNGLSEEAAVAVLKLARLHDTHWAAAVGADGLPLEERYVDTAAPSPDDLLETSELAEIVRAAVRKLPTNLNVAVMARWLQYGTVETHESVGKVLGVSKQSVQQKERMAFERLARSPKLVALVERKKST